MTAHTAIQAEQSPAEEALARFRAQWPAERCRNLATAITGTPAEREAAALKIAAQAMERNAATPAEQAVRGLLTDPELVALSKGQRKFARGGGL